MESPKNIKRIVTGLLCLSVLVLIGLHVFQHQRYIKLSQETDSQLVANGAVTTTGTAQQTAKENAPVVFRGKEPAYDIKALRSELSTQEQELEKADKKLTESEARDNELKKADIDFKSNFNDLFKELNLSPEKQEKFIDVFRKMGKSMPPILTNPSSDVPPQELEAGIKEYQDKFNAKFEELLGETDYERYTAWNERSESRDIVTNFNRLLSSDDQLTKDQEKALVEIWYKEQGKADYEKSE
jgi:septal ring factor EnvC (AmiA/AmiB activator)